MAIESNIQLVRNATLVLNYGGKKFLIDPMLAEQGAYPGFEGTANSHLRNPLVGLPIEPGSLMDADAVIVTHLHPDHWDEAAVKMLPKDKVLFAQNENDAEVIRSAGFSKVHIMSENSLFDDISFKKTHCQHGSDEAYANPQMAEILGKSSGVFFGKPGEKSVYIVGDTIWIEEVENNLKEFQPDIVVVNTGFAQVNGFGPIIFGKEDVLRIHEILPEATIIAVHMEAVNHCVLSRKELREYIAEKGIENSVVIPLDGELIAF
ncbi:MBL fold metallo-hydrolase [Olivibacter jilunii]|uniref:MBL fold metallo-hydrolase n=1 Tax=Olivibacter jilunii TaxID=985016 RepID=UPI003F161A26